MDIREFDSISALLDQDRFFFKLLVNESTLVFFPGTTQHRDVAVHGLSYEDDYSGNALAATVTPGRIDFRRHQSFSADRVTRIAMTMLATPELAFARDFRITYQGTPIATE